MKRGTRSTQRILGGLLLSLVLAGFLNRQVMHGQQAALPVVQTPDQATEVMAYQPPIGIPTPSFGIEEVAPTQPAAWPGAAAAGYYYIDKSHPSATDTNNPYGYPNRPRQNIPEMTYPAGSYLEIHGGDYADNYILVNFNCTRAQPCWVRGTAGNMPKISGTFVSLDRMTYVIFEYLDFEGGSGTSIEASAGNHMVLRHSVVHNKTWAGNNAGVAIGARAGEIVHDIVVYKNLFHDLGNWQATDDQDFQAVAPGLWGVDETSGAALYNYWILENTCYHISGDCVQVNAGWGQGAGNLLHHIYIGKNISYQNRQTGFWSKQARDVIMSQNVAYGGRAHGGNIGDGMGYQYSLNNLWLIYNELYDNNLGIRGSTDGDPNETIYIIGNIIRDNQHNLDPCGHWGSPFGWGISLWTGSTRYIVNNTIYNTRGGIELISGGNNAPTFISNNIIANLNGMDYVNNSPECGDFSVEPGKVEHLSTNYVTSVTIDHNLFAQTDGRPIRINGFQSLAAYQAASGQCANCRVSDPLFVNPAQQNFALQPGSPAIDSGIAHTVYQRFFDLYGLDIRVDHRNNPRPQGAGWDMGALEAAGSLTPALVAIAAAATQINLTWTDTSNNESGFKIERSSDGVNGWTPIATVGPNVTSYGNSGLACGSAYFYRVRAYNAGGDGPLSNIATAATNLCTPVLQPITGIGQTQLTLAWNDVSNIESGFKIERSPDGVNGWSQIATVNANVTTYINSGLTCGTPYFYRVRAYAGNSDSPYSNVVTASTTACQADLIFADGFESGSFIAWSASAVGNGDLRVTAAAALAGSSKGMEAVINDNSAMYVTDDQPAAETRYNARFYFDPNTITMINGNAHYLFSGYQGATQPVLRVEFRRYKNAYQLRAALLTDTTTWRNSSYITIKDQPYVIEVNWRAATAPGANNGQLTLWVNEVRVADLTGIDNDTRRIDRAQLGPLAGLDTGTRGAYYVDAFESRRYSYIGSMSGAALDKEQPIASEPFSITTTWLADNNQLVQLTDAMALQVSFPADPAGAPLAARIALTDTHTMPDGFALLGEMATVQVQPTGATAARPVDQTAVVTIHYGALVDSTIAPTDLSLHQWQAATSEWRLLPGSADPRAQTLSATVTTPAIFALMQLEANESSNEEKDKPFTFYLPLVQE